ncbi:hypothetical protein KAR91_69490 [Candidatus Pacearchaeota archaeon]|nr:hypothetical protein [Candidatus Pacearchaeota archaeon]
MGIGERVPKDSVDALQLVDGWNDLESSFIAGKVAGANVPVFAAFIDSINAFQFSATVMKEIFMMPLHVPHDYKPGSTMFHHIHWSPGDTDTGVVRWGIEYSIAKGHGQQAFPASTTIYLEQAGSGVANQHQIIEDTVGITANLEPDSLILMRVFRDATHGNDDYTGVAWGHFMDSHYQSDRMATKSKEPDFYT